MRFQVRAVVAAAFVALSVACGDRSAVAFGDLNSIIIIAPDSLWAEVEQDVRQALEPTILAVRDERMFDVTHVSPTDPDWTDLRKFRQLLVLGQPEASWVRPAVEQAGAAAAPGQLLVARSIWARGQTVDALPLPAEGQAEAVRQALPELSALYDGRIRRQVRERMYVSGVDTALAEALRGSAGFSLMLPQVYQRAEVDSVYRFVNAQPKGGQEIIRSILVAWREDTAEPTPEALLAWRADVSNEIYDPDQTVEAEYQVRRIEGQAAPAMEVTGTWSSVGSWPMAGPFVDRMIVCPAQNRTYLLDAYLFAPGEDKYEYMLQLQTILDTFECAGAS